MEPDVKIVPATPNPSASILLISPLNEILLLHRVRTSSAFPSAHVFPGGNLSPIQDGVIPSPTDPNRHEDGSAYRLGAIRECFEESGILLAKSKDGNGTLLHVPEAEREQARKDVHADKLLFKDWVEAKGGVSDLDGLIPFTRWITPNHVPKRFTTQMYIYFLPLSPNIAEKPSHSALSDQSVIPVPTSDGGVEHTAALFSPCSAWLSQATKNEIILFPPQFYLMDLLAQFLTAPPSEKTPSHIELQQQRIEVLKFIQTDGDGKGVKWGEKVISPTSLLFRKSDRRSVLALDRPGPELEGSGRRGDERRVVLVKFGKAGPCDVEVRERQEVLEEERKSSQGGKL